jgi:hypothetical protein
MAKQKAIENRFDGSFPVSDRYESKYFKYLGNEADGDILDAFRTRDIVKIERSLKSLADSIKNHIFIIGMGCVIIDREVMHNWWVGSRGVRTGKGRLWQALA